MRETADLAIVITRDGPYAVVGRIPLTPKFIAVDGEGQSRAWREGARFRVGAAYRLCRCGASSNKPFL